MSFLHTTVGLWLRYPAGFGTHGAVWTLALEAMFYLLLPLVAAWYYRRPLLGFLLALGVSMAWKLAVTWGADPRAWSYGRIVAIIQLPTYLAHFAAGMTGAWIFVRLRHRVTGPARRAAAVAVQVTAAVGLLLGMRLEGTRDLLARNGIYDHFTRPVYVAFTFAVLLVATALAPPWGQLPFANPLSRRLGDVSYGVYLWHLMFIGFAMTTLHWRPDASTWAFVRMVAFALPLSLLAGWLSMVLVERPAIRWARKRSAAISRRHDAVRARRPGATLARL
jgi:peptidoglycan/LPS O-acetylase OafA/YrhL